MRTGRSPITQFLRAEEIPRWFGLSLVLIYLVGLAAVANIGIASAKADARAYYHKSARVSLTHLADRLARVMRQQQDPALHAQKLNRALRDFAQRMPTRELYVVADDRVLASTLPGKVGTVLPAPDAHASQAGHGSGVWTVRLPLRPIGSGFGDDSSMAGAGAATGSLEGSARLVAVMPREPTAGSEFAVHAGMLAIILVVLGALFVTYRCVRQQLRGVSKIADRLETYGERLAADLSALRIADTTDAVVVPWNALIELAEGLRVSAEQGEANAELSKALRSAGNDSLSEALNAVPDGIIHIRAEDRFAFVNAAAARILGWSRDEHKTHTLVDSSATGAGAEVLSVIRAALRPSGQFEASSLMIEPEAKPDGDDTTYRIWVLPLPRGHADGECIVIVRDITQQLRADRAREEFVTQVTHELRTPLTNIRAYAETLSSGMFDDPKVVTECYNVITKETRRLSRLVEDILSVSQLEVGSMELAINQVDLRVVLEEGVRDIAGLADEKNIDLQLVLPAKLEPLVADRDKLAVVLNNLLGNAIKYTPDDGIVIVGCKMSEGEVVVTVKDNGTGIDPIDHARIFERFQRGSDVDAQAQAGTGIGLYTAREIVRRHGGEIELISEKGHGSTFLVKLPYSPQRAAAAVATAP